MSLSNTTSGIPEPPEVSYRVVFGPGGARRYTTAITREQMSTPLSVGAAVLFVAMTSWTAATQDSTAWMWMWAIAGPAYVVVSTSLTYWWVRRWLAPQASPGMYEATGAHADGLITESPRGRNIVPWSRIAGVRVRRDIVKLTFADPTQQIWLAPELLPPELLAWFPADVRPPR